MTNVANALEIELPMLTKAEEVYEKCNQGRIRRHRLYRNHRIPQKN